MPWHGSRVLRNDWIEKQTQHLVRISSVAARDVWETLLTLDGLSLLS